MPKIHKMHKHPNCVYYDCDSSSAGGKTTYQTHCRFSGKKCSWGPRKGCLNLIPRINESTKFGSTKEQYELIMKTLEDMFDRIFRKEMRRFNNNDFSKKRHKLGHYPFIRRYTTYLTSTFAFLSKIVASDTVRRKDAYTFLDCGAGVGNAVAIASAFGFDAYGLEYDKATLVRGKFLLDLFGLMPERLFQGDLLTYDEFDKWDILYTFCPLSDCKKELLFEDNMIRTAKIGAYITGISLLNRVEFNKSGARIGGSVKGPATEIAYFQSIRGDESEMRIYKKVRHEKIGPPPRKTRRRKA